MVTAEVKKVRIPTYEPGKPEKNPVFLENRVYQGSSGKVYPYPVIESISDQKTDREYTAVFLENEYLRIMILPELGGRIQRAYDKTNGYDFVYYNHVIKPALVGLTGPWISGGIEFNWPQHHRPTTFLPVDYLLTEGEDGSQSVLVHDVDRMYGTACLASYTLYPGKAYLEIRGQLYNRTPFPQTFLWWANPAVSVNDRTQSIFPPDVHAVMDHGKRDVSRFPIATGIYYKKDYSAGVDISRYRNIPVPTSYMAEKSAYDFMGGYDYGREAGILHVADHHISPGKKQWTWGCGDFGKAWDRNLTDEDGPYVELMTGVFTDNQPDFSWLKPFEEKVFTQYFMPYKKVGQVQNATKEAVLHAAIEEGRLHLILYTSQCYQQLQIRVRAGEQILFEEQAEVSPVRVYEKFLPAELLAGKEGAEHGLDHPETLITEVFAGTRCLVSYQPEAEQIPKLPEPARAAADPEEIKTNEELYLTGLHIEQYRHATYRPDPYYLEGLKRDPKDVRINQAYGMLLLRRGNFSLAEQHFRRALERLTEHNPNPYNSEPYYGLGLALLYRQREKEAYDAFFKAAWTAEQQEMSFFYLAVLAARQGRWEEACTFADRSLVKNAHNCKARGLRAYLLRRMGRQQEAVEQLASNLKLDPFDFVSANERVLFGGEQPQDCAELDRKMSSCSGNYRRCARDYAEFGAYEEAIGLLQRDPEKEPMRLYDLAFYNKMLGHAYRGLLKEAENCRPDYCFPNQLEDIAVLQMAIREGFVARAAYYLGNLYYDRSQSEQAIACWEQSAAAAADFPTVHRNLALAYYNKRQDAGRAEKELECAWNLNPKDVRVFLELDQLHKNRGWSFAARLKCYEAHRELIERRDAVYVEYITLLNLCGRSAEALSCMLSHHFHPWEGGEGKITQQYTLALLTLARQETGKEGAGRADWHKAEQLLEQAFTYPDNLGEGRLEGDKENRLYYELGCVNEKLGEPEKAMDCFRKATEGTGEPAGARYYNDQPADRILYQGLACRKLGDEPAANTHFYKLLDYGEKHLEDQVRTEYFAVSLPEFMIFEEDETRRNRAHCYYLMALGNIGLGQDKKAARFLQQALELEPAHMMCSIYKQKLEAGDFLPDKEKGAARHRETNKK